MERASPLKTKITELPAGYEEAIREFEQAVRLIPGCQRPASILDAYRRRLVNIRRLWDSWYHGR